MSSLNFKYSQRTIRRVGVETVDGLACPKCGGTEFALISSPGPWIFRAILFYKYLYPKMMRAGVKCRRCKQVYLRGMHARRGGDQPWVSSSYAAGRSISRLKQAARVTKDRRS